VVIPLFMETSTSIRTMWITSRQIEAGRRAMTRYAKRGGKLWIKNIPDKPVQKEQLTPNGV